MNKITITTTRYKEPNWLLHETLLSLSKQKKINADILFYDQFLNEETKKYCDDLSNENIKFNYILIEPKWLSFARNQAIRDCKSDILLYIDSDAIADEFWACELSKTFEKGKNIWVTWWKIIPKWHKTPIFLSKADYVYDIYSMLDLWDDMIENKKIVWANFWVNIKLLWKDAYFDENLWRKPWKLLWWEESDLCERIQNKWLEIFYNWKAVVHHQVLTERISILWILKRMYWWWYNRWLAWWTPKSSNWWWKFNIWNYIILPIVFPFYILWLIKWKNVRFNNK